MNIDPFLGMHIHFLFGFALLVGGVLFFVWAVKFLNKKKMLQVAIVLVVIGTIGALLTSSWGFKGMKIVMDEVLKCGDNEANFEMTTSYEDWYDNYLQARQQMYANTME